MEKLFLNNLGDLAESQRGSFYRFLLLGIEEELKLLVNPFRSRIKPPGRNKFLRVLVYSYANNIKVKGPNQNLACCRQKGLSYTLQIYLGAQYSYPFLEFSAKFGKEKKSLLTHFLNTEPAQIRVKQHIFLTEIPLMTEEGTFFINGCERVVIGQIIRSPGIYFRKEFGKSSKRIKYTATIISNKGFWTKFILDNDAVDGSHDDRVYIQLSELKRKKILSVQEKKRQKELDKSDESRLFVFDFFKYFGMTLEEIADSIKYPKYLGLQQLKGRTHTIALKKKRKRDPQLFLVYRFDRENEDTFSLIDDLFTTRGRNCFSLGEVGRYKANKNLGLNLPKHFTHLTSQDFIEILNGLIELKYFDRPNDDIDDIRNKLVRNVGELLQIQLRIGIAKLQKPFFTNSYFKKDSNRELFSFQLKEIQELNEYWLMDPKILTSTFRDFFTTSQLSQFLDQINPLAEITHKRRISVFGPNGLKRDHVSMKLRDIHPSHYSRLCPIETPEGKNAGLINTLALFGRIDYLGSLETPYFLVNQAKIASTKQPIFLNPHQEFQTRIGFADIVPNAFSFLPKKYLSIKENYLFSLQNTTELQFLTLSPIQILSVATALIPFLEHDDANRALMGSNMQRQAVPLLYLQKPIVGTGLEASVLLDSGMIVKSYCQGLVLGSSSTLLIIRDKADQVLNYRLTKYRRSNQETSFHQRPLVWPGENVFSNQIIADGPSSLEGELSLGKNLLIAYMPWEGYNYEDAIIINERILVEDCLTSVHIEEYEMNLIPFFEDLDEINRNLWYLTGFPSRNLDKNGIIRKGSFVKEHDVLIGKGTIYEGPLTPERRFLKALLEFDKKKKAKEEKKRKKEEIKAEQKRKKEEIKAEQKRKKQAEKLEKKRKKEDEKLEKKRKKEEAKAEQKRKKEEIKEEKKQKKEEEKNKKQGSEILQIIRAESPISRTEVSLKAVKLPVLPLELPIGSIEIPITSLPEFSQNPVQLSVVSVNPERVLAKEKKEKSLVKKKKNVKIKKKFRDSSLRAAKGTFGRVIDIRLFSTLPKEKAAITFFPPSRDLIRISIAQIRKLRVGDKLAGRHGNKGIVSRILSRQDMPYLPNGTAIDIIFNPLGVPSRMNVGQIFECLLGFAGEKAGNRFKVLPFDEIYGNEASRILINQKLKETSLTTTCKWLFNPIYPGKILLRDGRTGNFFDNPITVGKAYILKLIHLVEDKIHTRSTGPYALITEQPLAGKSQGGGQRFGEMEVWALEAFSCSYTLQELLTIKSDEIDGRHDMYEAIVMRKEIPKPIPSLPESFLALIRELHSLGLDFSLQKIDGFSKSEEKKIFDYLEVRLKLRALLTRQKLEQLSLLEKTEENEYLKDKQQEKKKCLDEFKQGTFFASF